MNTNHRGGDMKQMIDWKWWPVVIVIAVTLPLAGCMQTMRAGASAAADDGTSIEDARPATIEHVDGTDLNRVILSARAAERLDIQTVGVEETSTASAAHRTVVPYAAVLYDSSGGTWVYTSPKPLVFVRHRVTVADITGASAILSEGPPVGTNVVSAGASLLFGTELEGGN